MKKFLLLFTALVCSASTFAQLVSLKKDWLLKIGESSLITSHSSNGNPSVAYNKSTGKLYLSNWNDKISILNPDDGTLSSPSTLFTNPTWSSDPQKYVKIRVDDDGVIYAINRITAAGNIIIYRWASESDVTPSRTLIATDARAGDSFAVFGTGNDTKLFISAQNTSKVIVAKVIDGVVSKAYDITVGNDEARGSISAESSGSIWIKSATSGLALKRVNFAPLTGVVSSTETVAGTKINWAFANAEFFNDGINKYIIASGAVIGSTYYTTYGTNNLGLKMNIFDITNDISNPVLKADTEMFPIVTNSQPILSSNANAFGDVAVRRKSDGKLNFYHIVFGSGLISYSTTVGVLPVTLTSFNASLINNKSVLTWTTSAEQNSKGFEIHRSADGIKFNSIASVSSRGDNGNSSVSLNYTYIDKTAQNGINYYKLVQIDNDGKTEEFKDIRSLNLALSETSFTASPNPVTNNLLVTTGGLNPKGVKYEIFDSNGKKMIAEKAKGASQEISMEKLKTAIYYLKVSKDNVAQQTIKLVKL